VVDLIRTRFGELDRRLAAAVRHALEVAVFFPALAPLNDVHLRLTSMADLLGAEDVPAEPPSHRWGQHMVDLFGAAGARRSPVGRGVPDDVTAAHRDLARSRETTAAERRVIHHLVAAAAGFVLAEALRLNEIVDRWNLARADDAVDDSVVGPLLAARRVARRLAHTAAAGTWPALLDGEREPAATVAIPSQSRRSIPPSGSLDVAATAARRRFGHSLTGLGKFLALVVVLVLGAAAVREPAVTALAAMDAEATGAIERDDELETRHLRIALMTTTDLGPFWMAHERDDFAKAGLTFEIKYARSGTEAVAMLESGAVDLAYATYTPFFVAATRSTISASRGLVAASRTFDVQLVVGASAAGPGSCVVVAMPGGRVRKVEDMPGAKVAVTHRNTMSDLLIMSALREHGIDHRSIQWVEVPFEHMSAKLARGEIDAAFVTEPYLNETHRRVGAVTVFDTTIGPTLNLPTAAFGASADFVRHNRNTLAEFKRIMTDATAEAMAERAKVEPVLREFAHVDAETAKLSTLLTFQSALKEDRLRHVTNLMLEFGMIPRSIDVPSMIAKLPNR